MSNESQTKIYSRRFVPVDLVMKGREEAEQLLGRLEKIEIGDREKLMEWLLNWSESVAVIDEFCTRRYVAMTCHTDDEQISDDYLYVVREVEPLVTKLSHQLATKFVNGDGRKKLDKNFERLDREISVEVELFDEKNIPISTRLSELSQGYQQLAGSLTVEFDGEEKTLQQMSLYLHEQDRGLREKAFRAVSERRLEEKDKFESIFDKMLALRTSYATNLGLCDYRDYAFKSKLRDYTPEDCEKFHTAIEKEAVPLARKINERRKERMRLDSLAPWDTACDPLGRKPLKPFTDAKELFGGVQKMFANIDERLGRMFATLEGQIDLESRKGKAPGGYQTTYAEKRTPFIFTNAVGLHDDINTLLHEGGHAFHTLQCADNDLIWYRHASMEFSEVASMSMELLGLSQMNVFYDNDDDIKRVIEERYESVVSIFGWVAQVDAFQHYIYTNPDNNADQRAEKWMELSDRFGTGIDWSALPKDAQARQWHRQLHIFEVPFYYIEYAIAQLGALQIFFRYEDNPEKAIEDYLKALAIGGKYGPAKLFEAAQIKFDFSEEMLGDLMNRLADKMGL